MVADYPPHLGKRHAHRNSGTLNLASEVQRGVACVAFIGRDLALRGGRTARARGPRCTGRQGRWERLPHNKSDRTTLRRLTGYASLYHPVYTRRKSNLSNSIHVISALYN